MRTQLSFALVLPLALALAGCPGDEPNDGGDAGPAAAPCTSAVDGKVGGEACRCKEDNECAPGYACTNRFCFQVACETDDDCLEEGQVCIAHTGQCTDQICADDGECGAGRVCVGGACQIAPDPATVANCALSGAQVTRQGETAPLAAVAYSSGGAVVSRMAYEYSVSAGDSQVAVSAEGVMTGGTADGSWTVKATVAGTTVECTLSGRNYADVANESMRVVAIDTRTGGALVGATVVVSADEDRSLVTDDAGIADFGPVAGTVNAVSLFYRQDDWEADYFTILKPQGNDLMIPVTTYPVGKVSGVKGSFDFSKLPDRDLKLGLAGLSLQGSFADLDFMSLIGDLVPTQVDIPGLPLPEEGVPLPQGLTLAFGPQNFKPGFTALGLEGTRALWGLGAAFRLSDITSLLPTVAPLLQDADLDNLPFGTLLNALSPLINQMTHGVKLGTQVNLVSCNPTDDNDCPERVTGDFEEHVLPLSGGLDFRTSFAVPQLPGRPGGGEGWLSAALGLVAVEVPGQGVVPLGLGVGVDSLGEDDPADGRISGQEGQPGEQLAITYARRHSGLDGNDHWGLLLSLDVDGLLAEDGTALSGVVVRTPRLPVCTDLQSCSRQEVADRFLGFTVGSSYDVRNRTYTAGTAVDGASFYRLKMSGLDAGKGWAIYVDAGDHTGDIVVPAVPDGYEDRADSPWIQVFGTADVGLTDILSFNATNLDGINNVTKSFTALECTGGNGACALVNCDADAECSDGQVCTERACQDPPE
ncbi:MAG TPA: hypothetical protein DEB46_00975 [Myxococcales bacterium]|nr:hypothetical protein [Myxococcales bacterium]HBU46856.1 hypothetical protein [Myxococcales bacterium]